MMFTGIVQSLGTVVVVDDQRLGIRVDGDLDTSLAAGESVAVNGVDLPVGALVNVETDVLGRYVAHHLVEARDRARPERPGKADGDDHRSGPVA